MAVSTKGVYAGGGAYFVNIGSTLGGIGAVNTHNRQCSGAGGLWRQASCIRVKRGGIQMCICMEESWVV
jgi:hypothetical protein